jgi:hypothetical protein
MTTQLTQRDAVWNIMRDRKYHTLIEIAKMLGIPEQSASARVRDLRKPQFGGRNVRRRAINGVNEYRVV